MSVTFAPHWSIRLVYSAGMRSSGTGHGWPTPHFFCAVDLVDPALPFAVARFAVGHGLCETAPAAARDLQQSAAGHGVCRWPASAKLAECEAGGGDHCFLCRLLETLVAANTGCWKHWLLQRARGDEN